MEIRARVVAMWDTVWVTHVARFLFGIPIDESKKRGMMYVEVEGKTMAANKVIKILRKHKKALEGADPEIECPSCYGRFFESELVQSSPVQPPCECPKCGLRINPNFAPFPFITTGNSRPK